MKSIKNMTIYERVQVLNQLSLSTPVILDYLIKIHKDAITNSKPDKITRFWKTILTQLKHLRARYE